VESCITILHINVMAEAVHPSSRRRRRPQQIYRLLSVYASVFGVAFAIMVDRRGTVWPHKCDCHTVTEIHASMIEFFASAWSQRLSCNICAGRSLTLDNAQLENCCPLNNGRHVCMPISTGFSTSQPR